MIKIQIGILERTLEEVTPEWINQQINLRRKDGVFVSVKVIIKTGSINMMLSTPDEESTAQAGRVPNEQERVIFDLWNKHQLNDIHFSGGNLVAFLKQLVRVV